MATATAMIECEILRLELLISYLLARNSRIEGDLVDQLFKFQRKAPCPIAPSPCKFRQGRETGANRGKGQRGNVGGNGRHDASARESFYEQIPQVHIDYNGHLKVHNSLLNVVLCDKPETGTDDTPGRQAAARRAPWGACR